MCLDVAATRACYRAGAFHHRTAQKPRAAGARFTIDGARRAQRDPALPDDGQWECTERAGVVTCHGGGAAAGVVVGPPDPRWTCAPRRKHADERVCVQLSPERPPGAWKCGYEHLPAEIRVCEPADGTAQVGQACDGDGHCPLGTRCETGFCLPVRIAPACYLDADCDEWEACRYGTCVSARR